MRSKENEFNGRLGLRRKKYWSNSTSYEQFRTDMQREETSICSGGYREARCLALALELVELFNRNSVNLGFLAFK